MSNKQRILFIDRDGTLIREPEDEQIDSFAKLELLPGVVRWLGRIADELDYRLVLVSNQDGLGTEAFPLSDFEPVHGFLMRLLKAEGIRFEAQHIDRSFERDGLDTRKPGLGMLRGYLDGSFDLANSWVIGDRYTDLVLARNLGARVFLLEPAGSAALAAGTLLEGDHAVAHWSSIYECLRREERRVQHRRTTLETDVSVGLKLDGAGQCRVSTGLGFLDHMLDQLARHGGLDLEVDARGDLHVDEHHTIEDVAITLGEAFHAALGNKRGLARYGFSLPMDDARARADIDFGGRAYCQFTADFRRERVGDMPTELVSHFFRSFSDAARCTLHLEVTGENDHHQIEALFKAFARAIRQAVAVDLQDQAIPTTKGLL
ncbi:MAG: bifunctional histidinol-phosphatase/imidazoleglycerol-phosphate dehydratase HisB [Bacteroidetes bacterium]|nr:bifunctional histidinol-phosphatase/imidazoleglycerol-phosphate dehydratase HisB [Bacteroidota bacterium]